MWGYFAFTGAPYRAYLFRVGRRTQYWIIYTVDEEIRTVDILHFWNAMRDLGALRDFASVGVNRGQTATTPSRSPLPPGPRHDPRDPLGQVQQAAAQTPVPDRRIGLHQP
jgi:hypothetical protein